MAYQLTCELSANTCTDSAHLPWQLAKRRILQTRARLSAGAGARREAGEDQRLASPTGAMTLGPPTPAGSSLPGLVQTLTFKLRASANWHVQWSQGVCPPGLWPPGPGCPLSPQSGNLLCPLSAAGDIAASGWGIQRSRLGPGSPPQALGTPPGWPWAGGGRAPWLLPVCTADTRSGSPRTSSLGSQAS